MEKVPKNEEKCAETNGTKASCCQSKSPDDSFGQIDDLIGNFGKYQLLIFVFKILIGATSAFNNLGVTFFSPSGFISYWCADEAASSLTSTNPSTILPQSFNSTQITSSGSALSFAADNSQRIADTSVHNHSIYRDQPLAQIFSGFVYGDERSNRHNIQMNYDTPKNLRKECTYTSPSDKLKHKCTAYQYDTGIWISTIIDEWDLVCDRDWYNSVTQSLYMAGFIVSYLVFGYISDRFGRWRSMLIGALIEILSGFGCALAGSATVFMLFRFLLGLGNAGRSSSSYLIMIEWTGPKWRMHISALGSLGWALGYCFMPWITMYFLHFRHMQLFVCFYEIIFVIWLLCLPESPRWLLTHKRFDEAYVVLLKAAKFNGLIKESKISDSPGEKVWTKDGNQNKNGSPLYAAGIKFGQKSNNGSRDVESTSTGSSTDGCAGLKPYTIEEYDEKFKRLTNNMYAKEFTKNEDKLSFLDLFKWNNLRKYFLILAFVWAADSFIYYGIALRVGDFGGRNLFLAFTIAGLTELPSIAFTIICMKFLPRKMTNLFLFGATGLLCAVQLPLKYYDYHWLQQSSMMLAKLFNACSFTCILYQSMELFPTSIRQTAYSSCSLAGRIGSILAPFIKELSQITSNNVPPLIYAALSFVSAMLIRYLPETRGSDLPDTLLEAEKFEGTDKRESRQQASNTSELSLTRRTLHHTKSSNGLVASEELNN